MSLPPILPTGAMASGEYTDYMIGYLDGAMDSLDTQLDSYIGSVKLDDWSNQWTRTVRDINLDVAALNADMARLRAQCTMVSDAIKKL